MIISGNVLQRCQSGIESEKGKLWAKLPADVNQFIPPGDMYLCHELAELLSINHFCDEFGHFCC